MWKRNKKPSPNHTEPNFDIDETENQHMLVTVSRQIPVRNVSYLKRIKVRVGNKDMYALWLNQLLTRLRQK